MILSSQNPQSHWRLLNAQEIADLLGVKKSTIYQWTHQGFIPHVKIGKLVRFKVNTVVNWVNERETKGRKHRSHVFDTGNYNPRREKE